SRPSRLKLGWARYGAAAGLGIFWVLLLGLPLLTLVLSSFRHEAGALGWQGWSLSKWIYVFEELPDFPRASFNSVVSSAMAGVLAMMGGLLLALLSRSSQKKAQTLTQGLQGVFSLLFSLPGTVLALLLVIFWARLPALSLSNTL